MGRYSRGFGVAALLCLSSALGACAAEIDTEAAAGPSEIGVIGQMLNANDCPAGYNLIQGTSGNDTLNGTAGNDCILGLGGNDTIHGLGGNDYIAGGNGDDFLYGDDGNDQVFGEAGIDRIEGNGGSDSLYGGGGNDPIYGGAGNDTIYGGANVDTIYGEDGDDVIDGEDGEDIIDGGSGRDAIHGGDGDDVVHGGADNDVIHGDGGLDTLYGDDGDDVIDGDTQNDTLYGGNGDDVLYGDAANDTLKGEGGDDALIGGAGTNTSDGGAGTDACSGANCEKPEMTLSGCTATSQCSSGKHCIADFGLCIGCVSDQDSDAVCDSKDGCPNDGAKTAAEVCGCGVADTDGDSDGTPNCVDGCPSDATKIAAGACGCGVADADGDSDGTANCNDGCPTDAMKIAAGVCGCGVADADSDGDGTADCNDGCPADANKIAAGACGCGVADTDTDGDGIANCVDGCPTDANKGAPGACGCGVLDTDGDGDGVANCNDGCPADANKALPGTCGCGVADTDGDGDGLANCIDGCPSDPNKTAAGICGCGVSDADSDGDGVANCHDICPGIADTGFDCLPYGQLRTHPLADEVFAAGFTPQTSIGVLDVAVYHPFSGDGSTIVGFQNDYSGTDDRAFRWTLSNGLEWLADLPGQSASGGAFAVSADGTVVGGHGSSNGFVAVEGCRWVGAPGTNPSPQPLTTFGGDLAKYTYASAWDGQTMVGGGEHRTTGVQKAAFRWTPAGQQSLDYLVSGGDAVATDVSADGSVVVGWATSPRPGALWEPFRWTAASGMVGLGLLTPGTSNQWGRATAVSADGQTIVGWTKYAHSCGGSCDPKFEPRAFRWTATTGMQPLPLLLPPATSTATYAHAVSPDGSVVLGTNSGGSGYFVWSQARGAEDVRGALTRLGINVNGWTLSAIATLKIGNTTYLTGYGRYQNGSPVVWRAAYQ